VGPRKKDKLNKIFTYIQDHRNFLLTAKLFERIYSVRGFVSNLYQDRLVPMFHADLYMKTIGLKQNGDRVSLQTYL